MKNREKPHKWTYFGGIGSGKGWHQLMLFIAPDELYTLLSSTDYFLLITNSRVPISYNSTSKEDYRAYYEKYCATVQASQMVTWQITHPLRISLTHVDTNVENELIKGGQYKLLRTSEPVINLMPLQISYEPHQLRVNVSSSDEATFGLVLSFPKVVFYAQSGFEQAQSTDKMCNRTIYDNMVKEVLAISRPCIFQDEERDYRTRIRITAKAKEFAIHHDFLIQHHISLGFSARKNPSIGTVA